MKVTIVNHGKVFGSDNWYTFYCPNCKNQLVGRQENCSNISNPFAKACGVKLEWKKL